MSVNSKMTAIADKIRSLLGITGKLGLDAMNTNLETANTEVSTQEELMEEILTTLAEKSANTGETAKPEQEKIIDITENGTTEVLPDSGKVLSKVTVNVDVQSGGGSGSSGEIITLATPLNNALEACDLFSALCDEGEILVSFKNTKTKEQYSLTNEGVIMIIKDRATNSNDSQKAMFSRFTKQGNNVTVQSIVTKDYDFFCSVGDAFEKVVIL